ncbi:MAG: EAL domain-containing protein [Gallionella sp.]|jgi:diguanylate cyclase (GGDEF)-like protein/PAS domain S-box-containing protein
MPHHIFEDVKAMQELVDVLPIAIFIKNAKSQFQLMNKACEEQWGMCFSDLHGTDASQFFPPDQMEWFLAKDREIFIGGSQVDFEESFWNATLGQNRIGHTFKKPIYDAAGNPLYLICLTIDITDRKKTNQELRLNEEKLRAMFDMSPLGMVRNSMDGAFIEANNSLLNIVGYSLQELNRLSYWDLTPDCYAEQEQQQLESLRTSGKYGPYEKEYINNRGQRVPVRLNGVQITGSDGEKFIWSIIEDITERKGAEQQIHQLAFFDPLTDLPNRRLLMDRLRQALSASVRNGQHGAVIFIDLDNFKTLNDRHGHDVGDLLLLEVARRLKTCVREGDTVARLGGDEFVVVLETLSVNLDDAATQAELVTEEIQSSLNQTYQLKEYLHYSTSSIGIVLFRGHQESIENIIRHADTAMYQAKAAGRNAIRFYDPEMQAAIELRAELENELRQALDKQQFRLFYQIQVDSIRRSLGAEVLIRWVHPERGLVSPAQFIPLAEETGLIVPIGLWVLQTAAAQLKTWQQNPLTRDLTLAVNVSARQFQLPNFHSQVQQILLTSGADPTRLKLELTEGTVLEQIEESTAKMHDLKKLGVRFSMDDFGTGYSSLAYLTQLPLDQLKIDQSFVRNIGVKPTDAVIAQTIIGMANNLGMEVIAEGVETEAQCAFLEQNGCSLYQGYLFGKPVPLAEFEEKLSVYVPVYTADSQA